MLRRFRKNALGTLMLTMLLGFSVGPGLALHLLGDAFHNAHAHHHHAFDFSADLDIDHLNDSDADHSCAFDHDHDRSHAASLTIGCLAPPVVIAAVQFDGTPVVYPPAAHRAPPLGTTASIDKPPRLIASV